VKKQLALRVVELPRENNIPRRKLIEGRFMRCPRCKRQHDVLQYVPLEIIEEFAAETTPVYKCPKCKWIFAPADELVADLLLRMLIANQNKEAVPQS
jgi:uncharacterized C2H2 Zn-finger protein